MTNNINTYIGPTIQDHLDIATRNPTHVVETIADLDTIESRYLVDGQTYQVMSYLSGKFNGGDWFKYSASSTATVNGGTIIDGPGSVGRYLALNQDVANAKEFGAIDDGTEPVATRLSILAAMDSAGEYGKVVIPKGTFAIDKSIKTQHIGQTLVFIGKLLLIDGGTATTSVLEIAHANTILINPRLDMDRASNTSDAVNGTQSVLAQYGPSEGLRVYGGILEGGIDNAYQGGRNDTVLTDTKFKNSGEHAIYVSGTGSESGLTFSNCSINGTGKRLVGGEEGHLIQVRDFNDVSVIGGIFDTESPTAASFMINLINSHNFKMIGSNAKNLNHRGIRVASDCSNIKIDKTTLTWVSSPVTRSAIHSQGSNVHVINSIFIGGTLIEQPSSPLKGCQFLEQTIGTQPTGDLIAENCLFDFDLVTLPTRGFTADGGVDIDLKGCKFSGGQPTSTLVTARPAFTGTLVVEDCEFPTWNGANGIYMIAGKNNVCNRNHLPLSTNVSTIKLSGSNTGIVNLDGNILPLGDMALDNTIEILDKGNTTVNGFVKSSQITSVSVIDLSLLRPTELNSSSNAITATLLDGKSVGDMKIVTITNASNASTLSVNSHQTSNPEVFNFTVVNQFVVLRWLGNYWITDAATATT